MPLTWNHQLNNKYQKIQHNPLNIKHTLGIRAFKKTALKAAWILGFRVGVLNASKLKIEY